MRPDLASRPRARTCLSLSLSISCFLPGTRASLLSRLPPHPPARTCGPSAGFSSVRQGLYPRRLGCVNTRRSPLQHPSCSVLTPGPLFLSLLSKSTFTSNSNTTADLYD